MRFLFVYFIIYYSSACAFGSNSQFKWKRETHTKWNELKEGHVGRNLLNQDLKAIVNLSNESHFNKTLAPIMVVRTVGSKEHTQVRKFITSEMEGLGWSVWEHYFTDDTPIGEKKFTNVIATLDPTATRRLVIACHYDSKVTPTGFIGATDSAVPCAMMIHLAHILHNQLKAYSQKNSDLTLQFIFFDGEEAFQYWSSRDSLYGSRALAEHLSNIKFPALGSHRTTELDRIDLFVLLDLLGTKDCYLRSFFKNTHNWYQTLKSYNQALFSSQKDWEKLFRGKSFYSSVQDDHVPFMKKGVPILHLISSPFPSVWHQITDNGDALHYPTIARLNALLRAFVIHYLHLDI